MTAWVHPFGYLGLGLSLLCAFALAVRADTSQDAVLHAQLVRLSQRRIFFGHQSVGMNLLDGVREIAAGYPDVRFRVVESPAGPDPTPGTFAHAFIPENGNPALKLESFERALSSDVTPDIAFLKFCYVDFSTGTDARALFARYQATVSALRSRYPRTVFVHITAPLTTVQGGAKAALGRLLGRAPGGLRENARREEYSDLLRQAYRDKEPVFDLAVLESTAADGHRELHHWNGSKVPALLPAWTDDGGHLNPEARQRLARELIGFLAGLP